MKRILLLIVIVVVFMPVSTVAQMEVRKISVIEETMNNIQQRQAELNIKMQQLMSISNKNDRDIMVLKQYNDVLCKSIDYLKTVCDSMKKAQTVDRSMINGKIQETNNTLVLTQSVVKDRTVLGGIIITIILFALPLLYYYLAKRIRSGIFSIDEVRKAQEALQSAQTKMQEESVRLDDKLLELFDKQISAVPKVVGNDKPNHSLALKVADEIVRIELNMSRMDSSIKGYKQLSKAVERIKDNFKANGYEIVDMLGKPYNEGMKVTANFVADEDLEEGKQIITGITKPQINYNGQMIQAAQITVSQNI